MQDGCHRLILRAPVRVPGVEWIAPVKGAKPSEADEVLLT